jgi:hypothetical protein
MSAHAEKHGTSWIVFDTVQLGDRTIESFWSGDGWIQVKDRAQRFRTKAAANNAANGIEPIEIKQVSSAATMPVAWSDRRGLSQVLLRAEAMLADGRLPDAVAALTLIQAIQSGDPDREELGYRLRDMCDLAEARSLAQSLFGRIMQQAPSGRANFIRAMVGSTPPTFEEEWLDFKSGIQGSLARSESLSEDKIKEIWSKSLAGFANTGGGVLIWGIDARPMPSAGTGKTVDAASNLRLVPHPDALKSDLNRLHHTATDPPVAEVRVEPVMDKAGGGFVVCLIPESSHKPHRAEFITNKPYYLRAGDDFVVMSPAVLRSMFYPRTSPRFAVRIDCRGRNLQTTVATFDFCVTIRNVGNATAREPFVVLQVSPYGTTVPSVNHGIG